MKLVRQQIEGPVISLPLSFLGQRDRNRRVPFPPRPPTDVPPHSGTFVVRAKHRCARSSALLLPSAVPVFFYSPPAAPTLAPRSVSDCPSPCGDNSARARRVTRKRIVWTDRRCHSALPSPSRTSSDRPGLLRPQPIFNLLPLLDTQITLTPPVPYL